MQRGNFISPQLGDSNGPIPIRPPAHSLFGLLGRGKQQLISVGIDDLDHVVTPPGLLGGNRALDDFTAKCGESIDVQCHEQARLVCSRGILAKDDLASRAMDLADPARAVALMPILLEAEHVDVKPKCTVHVSNEEHGTRVPAVSDLLADGCLGHDGSRSAQLVVGRAAYYSQTCEARNIRPKPTRRKDSRGGLNTKSQAKRESKSA